MTVASAPAPQHTSPASIPPRPPRRLPCPLAPPRTSRCAIWAPAAAQNVSVASVGFAISTNCPTTLAVGAECNIALSGTQAGTLTAQASNARTQTASIPAFTATATPISFYPRELDFGTQTSSAAPILRTLTVSNLSLLSQTFTSAGDGITRNNPTPFYEASSTCPVGAAAGTKVLAAGATCQITFALALLATTVDGPVQAQWTVAVSGKHEVLFTGFAQSASLSVSASTVDFGAQFTGGLRSARFLYLSNNGDTAIAHTAAFLPSGSPFTIVDHCSQSLAPHSVCQLQLAYESPTTPSNDSLTLSLDAGLTVLVTGQTLPQTGTTGSSVNPNLSVTPASLVFADSVPVTAQSGSTQAVTIANTGATPFSLSLAISGDFTETTNCPAALPASTSCSAVVTFAPTAPGTRQGLMMVTAGAGTTPAYVQLSGTGTGILPTNNGILAFPAVPITEPVVQWYKVSQPFQTLSVVTSGSFTAILVEDIGFGHGSPSTTAFQPHVSGSCLNCYLGLQFLPTDPGSQSATLTLTSAPSGNPYSLTLTGTGLPLTGPLLTPLQSDFGTVPIHSTSQTTLFALTNLVTPAATLAVNPPSTTGDFAVSSAPSGGAACGGPLAAGATCFAQVNLSPAASGQRTGILSLQTSSGTVTASLSGFGDVDPGVSLNPNALTFSNVPGQSSTQQTVLVTNTGSAILQVGAPATSGSTFSASSTCTILTSGATCLVNTTYTPSDAPSTGVLTIPITDTTSGSPVITGYAVPLAGSYTQQDAGLQFLPAQVDFGPAAAAAFGPTRLVTLNNLTGKAASVTLSLPRQFALTTPNACPTLAANGSCTFGITYVPLTSGAATGTLFAQATPGDGSAALNGLMYFQGFGLTPVTSTLAVSGPLSPGTGLLDFGQVASGQSVSKTLTITNTSATQSVTVRRVTSNPPFFALSTCGAALAPGAVCTVTVSYSPVSQVSPGTPAAAATSITGTLTIESDAVSSPNLVNLSGSVTSAASSTPATPVIAAYTVSQGSLTFASTSVGDVSPAQTVTLSNSGNTTLHNFVFQTTGDFTVSSDCPQSLVSGAACTISLAFTPKASGARTSAVAISTDAATPLDFISLSGTSNPSSLQLSATTLAFGGHTIASSTAMPLQITNNGQTPVSITGITASGDYAVASNCPAILLPAAVCTATVTFTPVAVGSRTGTLTLNSSATTLPLTVVLTGTGLQQHLSVSASSLDFGATALGNHVTLPLQITNDSQAPVTVGGITPSGDYTIAGDCPGPGAALAPAAVCTLQVTFTPSAVGVRSGSLSIASSATTVPIMISLTGVGTQSHLLVSPAALAFGSVNVGSTSSLFLTLTNNGTATLAGITLSITGDYTITTPCSASLLPGAFCNVVISFTPTASGTRIGALTATGSDPSSATTVPLTGTGIDAATGVGAPSFDLAVTSSPTATVHAGTPTSFSLTVTPRNNFAGAVVLSCTPVNSIQFASCSLAPPAVTLAGAPLGSTLTVNTITSLQSSLAPSPARLFLSLAAPGLIFLLRIRRPRMLLFSFLFAVLGLGLSGCGGGPNPNLRYVLPGTYQFQVSAASATGTTVSRSVTVTVIVTN